MLDIQCHHRNTLSLHSFFSTHRVLLAPMAGVTDTAFRMLCRECGADLVYTEMVSAKGLSYANNKTRHLLNLAPEEDLVAVQLFGHEPETMAAQAIWVEDTLGSRLAYIDINMGCPARKIVSKGDGAALMENPKLAASIVAALVKAVTHPVTAKFRKAWAEGDETAVEFARQLEAAGVAAVCVHGRCAKQLYRGVSDHGVIARVKQAVSVPVIGSGDVRSGTDAVALIHDTNCDAIMIARAAEGNPWVFSQVKAVLAGESETLQPSVHERIEMARRHTRLLASYDATVLVRMRRHAMHYVAGLPGASVARARFCSCSSVEDFDAVFDELLAEQSAHE